MAKWKMTQERRNPLPSAGEPITRNEVMSNQKSVEEQAADELDRKSSEKILEQGGENGNVLVVDGVVRAASGNEAGSQDALCPPNDVEGDARRTTGGDGCVPPVRQPCVRESGSPVPGDAQAEHGRCESQAQDQERRDVSARVQAGAQSDGQGKCVLEPSRVSQVSSVREVGRPPSIHAQHDGQLVGSTFEDQFRLARAYHASGLMPQALNSPEKVLVAIQLCREMSLPPMTSVGKICIVNGTPSIFGELPLALVMRSGKLESIREWYFDEKGDRLDPSKSMPEYYGAACEIKRAGMDPIQRFFTRRDAEKGGLWGKRVWAVYPKRMMQMRCRSWALKDAFPDIMLGVPILEYDHNTTFEAGDQQDAGNQAAARVEKFVNTHESAQ